MPHLSKEALHRIEADLEMLQARVDSLEAQVSLPRQQATERLEQAKQRMRDALDDVKGEFSRQQSLAAEHRQKLAQAVDELKLQIALGKAETRDAIEAQSKTFESAVGSFEHVTAAEMSKTAHYLWEYYQQVRNRLEAEFDAANVRAREEMSNQWEKRKADLLGQVRHWREELEVERKKRAQKWEQFQGELKPALDQIAHAFKSLRG
ncbi:MAG: hypothetical protein ACYCW6_13945 [Candidatus Xenobia bacterium]